MLVMENNQVDLPKKEKVIIVEGEKKTQQIVSDIKALCNMIPNSPQFLGRKDDLLNPTKKRRFSSDKYPLLNDIRNDVIRVAEQKGVNNPRKKIKKLIKKYPFYSDLRALNGIQIFNDTAQSGLSERKLNALRNALIEIAKPLHNDGMSIFNATWFIKIYLKYLESLRERITKELNSLSNHYSWNIQQAINELKQGLIELNSLIAVKDKLNGLMMLNAKMKNTVYNTSCITMNELKIAAAAMRQDETKTVGTGKTANYIMYVTITLSLLFARIPILEYLVKDILNSMTESSRDVLLQKSMIGTMIGITSFQMASGAGNSEKAKELALMIYKRCRSIISQHLEHSTLSKPHEIDPFLKTAWIVKESDGLIETDEYKKMVFTANKKLRRVLASSGDVKGSVDLARQLQADIQDLMKKYDISEI